MTDSLSEWSIIGYSQIGFSHLAKEKPNQDAILKKTLPDKNLYLAAVSDGHGSDRYFRSNIGSKLAVETAIQVAEDFFSGLESPNISDLEWQLEILGRRIIFNWKAAVKDHFLNHPFDGIHENSALLPEREDNYIVAYGATILLVIIKNNYLISLQLGDGDILSVNSNLEITNLMADDPTLIANETSSLCQDNANDNWRYSFSSFNTTKDMPNLIMMCTDGYYNSYSNDKDFHKVFTDIAKMIMMNGLEVVENKLPVWLEKTTKSGSGDDISVLLIANMRSEVDVPKLTNNSETENIQSCLIEEFNENVKSENILEENDGSNVFNDLAKATEVFEILTTTKVSDIENISPHNNLMSEPINLSSNIGISNDPNVKEFEEFNKSSQNSIVKKMNNEVSVIENVNSNLENTSLHTETNLESDKPFLDNDDNTYIMKDNSSKNITHDTETTNDTKGNHKKKSLLSRIFSFNSK